MNSYFALIVVIFAIIGCAQAEGRNHREEYKKIEQECVKETGGNFAVITNIEMGQADDTADLKCFPKCVFVKAQYMNETGDLNLDVIGAGQLKKGDIEKREPILNECLPKKGANVCETADLIFRCYWAGINKAGLKY